MPYIKCSVQDGAFDTYIATLHEILCHVIDTIKCPKMSWNGILRHFMTYMPGHKMSCNIAFEITMDTDFKPKKAEVKISDFSLWFSAFPL